MPPDLQQISIGWLQRPLPHQLTRWNFKQAKWDLYKNSQIWYNLPNILQKTTRPYKTISNKEYYWPVPNQFPNSHPPSITRNLGWVKNWDYRNNNVKFYIRDISDKKPFRDFWCRSVIEQKTRNLSANIREDHGFCLLRVWISRLPWVGFTKTWEELLERKCEIFQYWEKVQTFTAQYPKLLINWHICIQ